MEQEPQFILFGYITFVAVVIVSLLLFQAEEHMLVLVKRAQGWRRELRMIKAERAQALVQVAERDNELSGKLMQIKQARNYLQEERSARIKAEQDRDNLQKQLRLIQDLVFSVSCQFVILHSSVFRILRLPLIPLAYL